MRNDFESNYLAHHGILGMKWGHKNGPPYPLGASDHSTSEKKAGYRKSLGGGRNEELYDRKEKKITKKYDKKLAKSQKKDQNTLDQREAHRQRKVARFDKKITKVKRDIASYEPIKNGLKDKKGRDILTKKDVESSIAGLKKVQKDLETQKKTWTDDFDLGTKYIKKGQERYNNVIKNYKDAKLAALENKAYRDVPEYKDTVKAYVKQKATDIWLAGYGGSQLTKLDYAFDVAVNEEYKKEQRKNSSVQKKKKTK